MNVSVSQVVRTTAVIGAIGPRGRASTGHRRRGLAFPVVLSGTLLMAALLVLTGCTETDKATNKATDKATGSAQVPPSAGASVGETTSQTGTGQTGTGQPQGSVTPGATAGAVAFPYQPLWPFASAADARAWQTGSSPEGHQPWHLDPAATALSFTRDFLGFTDVDRTLASTVTGDDARVQVGYATEGGRTGVAAVVHLARFGSGGDAPWEVVGTDDTTFSLTRPAYGASVTASLTAGGRITGVDESIHVQVRPVAGSGGQVVGEYCCLPAGGQQSTWTVNVKISARPGQGLVVVASTGGHLHGVERFTVTGVRYQG
ncbi:hypothetical protein FDG2_2678 [Candidatus Protofrankia californiensis]|uniref:Uncharacterized protein n=1 Tax=Candidatus Protofrankia californiensis TaxID=1839754 RepID=A0A1C3NY66_9ACTN|nr:hypothetical protein FDG2_2678 [Candidatus Protofrankia californiensis]